MCKRVTCKWKVNDGGVDILLRHRPGWVSAGGSRNAPWQGHRPGWVSLLEALEMPLGRVKLIQSMYS